MKCRMLLCAVLFGVFVFGGANPSPSQKKDEPPKKAAEGDDLAKLGKARLGAAEKAYQAWLKDERFAGFNGLPYQLSVGWLNAELDIATKTEERIAAYSDHLRRMKDWEKKANGRDGSLSVVYASIESFRREAEYWVAKERSGKK